MEKTSSIELHLKEFSEAIASSTGKDIEELKGTKVLRGVFNGIANEDTLLRLFFKGVKLISLIDDAKVLEKVN